MGDGQLHLDPATYLEAVRAEVPVYDELQRAIADATGPGPVQRALDLGTGTGETARAVLARHPGASLVAVDAMPEMVEIAGHPTLASSKSLALETAALVAAAEASLPTPAAGC